MKPEAFLPPLLLEHDGEKPWQAWVPGAVLFADVSGFTPMSEALAVLGAEGGEVLTDVLNRYFAAMIGIVHAHGGQVMKFGGDAILCFFPETGAGDGAAPFRVRPSTQAEACGQMASSLSSALRAAGLMQGEMARLQHIKTPVKRFALKMKIGVAHGECLLAGVGDPAVRCDYVFAGAPVDATSDAEHHAAAGEIVLACNRTLQGAQDTTGQKAKWKMEEVAPGFHRILEVPAALETPDGRPRRAGGQATHPPGPPASPRIGEAPAAGYRLSAAASSYLIREVHDLVASGHKAQVGALLEIVPVFLKFGGFTYTREAFDLELFNAFFRTVMEITERHGGRLNRISMGDKGSTALLLFGAPNPLEKKEQLASQWALDLFAAVRARFPRLEVGAGLNSGRVFTGIVGGAGRWEYTVMGDAVNFAARLMQGAEAGQACASESFVQRAREVYAFDDLGTRRFKGKAEPLAVYALKERRKAGWTAGGVEQSVRRERETQILLEKLDRAWEGEPGMAVIEGEAGVGKSFLAARILQEATRKGWRTVPAKGEITLRSHAYAPWREVGSALLFQGRDPSVEGLAEVLDGEQKPLMAWFCEFLGLPVPEGTVQPVQDEETRKRLFHHHLSRLLLNVAVPASAGTPPNMEASRTLKGAATSKAEGETASLIFLDDLHWFDTLSLEFLAALLNHLKDQRLFILAAARPEWEKKEFEHRATVSILSLGDLDQQGCKVLAEGRLGGKVRDALADFLYDRTKGNPFFTHQLLDYLLHEDLLETRLGEWLLKRGVEQRGAMSGTEVLLAQINRLPAAEQAHLQAAACIGPTFDLAVLKAVLGRSYRTKVLNSLMASGYLFGAGDSQAAVRTEDSTDQRTLKGAATSSIGEKLRTLSFPHALVQETIYQTLPQRVRRRLHRKIAFAMEVLHAGALEPLYPNLANHFHLGGVRAQAADYSARAGEMLLGRLSFPEAAEYLKRAWELARRDDMARRWEAALRAAQAFSKAGRLQEALKASRWVAHRARKAGQTEVHIRALLEQFEAMAKMGDHSYVRMETALFKLIDDARLMLYSWPIHYYIGYAFFRQGNYAKALTYLDKAINANDQESTQRFVLSAIGFKAAIERYRGAFKDALHNLEMGIKIAKESQNIYHELKLNIEYAGTLMENKQYAAAEKLYRALLVRTESFGDYYLNATICLNLGYLHIGLQKWDPAHDYLLEAERLFSTLGSLNGRSVSLMNLGILAFSTGDHQEAYARYLEATRLVEKSGEMTEACHGYYNLAEVCTVLGRKEEAGEWWEKGIRSFRPEDNPALHRMFMDLQKLL